MLMCYFYFDGKSSREFDLKIVQKENKSITFFGIARDNNIEVIPNSHKAYCLGSKYSPLAFELTLWSGDKPLTREKRIEICHWLFKDDFCELYSEQEPDVIYYCKLSDNVDRYLAMGDLGYLDIKVQCDSPFAWSRPMIQTFDLRHELAPPFPYEFQVRNDSNYKDWYENVFKIKMPPSGTDFEYKIWNKTNSASENAFIISSNLGSFPLQQDEFLQIDMTTGDIYTDARIGVGEPYAHRRKNTNKKFITLDYGTNDIEFTGNCILEVVTQCPVLQ